MLAFCVFMTNVSGLLVLISYCMALHPVDKKLDSGSSSSVIFNKKRKGESGQKPVFNFTYLFFKGFPVFKMNKGVIGKPGKVKSEELGNFNMISSLVYPLVVMSLVFLLVMFVSWNGPVESMYPMFRFVWSFAMTPLWIVCIAGLSLFVFIVIVGCVSICSKYHGALVGESWKKKSSKVTSN
nr:NADH dehydrogenase subunit 6 [Pholas orientalis]